MGKQKISYICLECQDKSEQWLGRCPSCGAWNSLCEVDTKVPQSSRKTKDCQKIYRLSEVDSVTHQRQSTGISEFDRVLGGGLVAGTLCLLAGEPGVGKSTLIMSLLHSLSLEDSKVQTLYVSGEESVEQVATRAKRMKVHSSAIGLINEMNLEEIKKCIEKFEAKIVVIDSIQTTYVEDVGSALGSASQVKEVTYQLMELAKAKGISIIVIGHITKDGSVAGPKLLEHMVDVVLYLEGAPYEQRRIVRAQKNRFGDTREIGIFNMNELGIQEYVQDVTNSGVSEIGRVLTLVTEGSRDFIVEVQALITESGGQVGRRVCSGYDSSRLLMIIAMIEKIMARKLISHDIYLSTTSTSRLGHVEMDLAVIKAILSSIDGVKEDSRTLYLGEVLLTGGVRVESDAGRKIKRAAQLGYKTIALNTQQTNISPRQGIEVKNVNHVGKLRN